MKSGEFISSSFLLKLVMRCSFLSPETEIYTKTGESRTDGGLLDILVMVLSFLPDQRPHLVMVFSFLLDQRPHVETPRPPNTTPGLFVKCVTADPGPDTVTMTS